MQSTDMAEHNVPERGRAALLTVDLQRDFTRAGSPVRSSGVGGAMPNIAALIEAFRARRAPIFHALWLYRPDGSNVDLFRRRAVEEGLRVLMPGTLGAELPAEVSPDPKQRLDAESLLSGEFQQLGDREWAVYKPRWGAFFGTTLEQRLREMAVSTVVICGCNFPTGGRASIYEGCARDFRVVVGSDAVCDANDDGLRELGRLGVYQMTTSACLAWLNGAQRATAA